MDFGVIVIGAGPGGYPAALEAARLGAKACLIEAGQVGGTCLNRGCIPTKALVESASALRLAKKAAEFGVKTGEISLDYHRAHARQQEIVSKVRKGVHFLLEKNKVTLVAGKGRLAGPHQVEVVRENGKTEVISGEKIILATGSEPLLPAGLSYDGKAVVSSTDLLEMDELPVSLLIVGGGVIGCEFAGIYSEMGVNVTLVEAQPTILPNVDEDLARKLQSLFKQRGVNLRTRTKIRKVSRTGGIVKVELEDGSEIVAEKVLLAVGRSLNTSGLGLEETGVGLGDRGEVLVNERLETSVPGVYAVGDITGKALLAHVATAQGLAAASNALGLSKEVDYSAVPNCIFTYPEIGSAGSTTRELKAEGIPFKTGRFPFTANGRALCEGETEGFVKVLAAEETGKILGIHIIGPHATELIAEGTLAIRWGLTLEQFEETIHAHPTLAEALADACRLASGKGF